LLQLVRRKEPLSIIDESPQPLPAVKEESKTLSNALITVLSINVFVVASVASFCLFLFFFEK
jgi:hypothetical protein